MGLLWNLGQHPLQHAMSHLICVVFDACAADKHSPNLLCCSLSPATGPAPATQIRLPGQQAMPCLPAEQGWWRQPWGHDCGPALGTLTQTDALNHALLYCHIRLAAFRLLGQIPVALPDAVLS